MACTYRRDFPQGDEACDMIKFLGGRFGMVTIRGTLEEHLHIQVSGDTTTPLGFLIIHLISSNRSKEDLPHVCQRSGNVV